MRHKFTVNREADISLVMSIDSLLFNLVVDLQGRVVRNPVNANPGLKVNRRIDFSCMKMFFTS